MKVLIIAAHGSRKETSNNEVAELAGRLAEKTKERFDRVTHAFLQFADPLLETTLDTVANQGAQTVTIFPLFIGSGSHIREDIPNLVEQARKNHPQVNFRLTRHLGQIPAIEELILSEAIPEPD